MNPAKASSSARTFAERPVLAAGAGAHGLRRWLISTSTWGANLWTIRTPVKANAAAKKNLCKMFPDEAVGRGCWSHHCFWTIDQTGSGGPWHISPHGIRNQHTLPVALLAFPGDALVYFPLDGPRPRWWRLELVSIRMSGSAQGKAPKSRREENQGRFNPQMPLPHQEPIDGQNLSQPF